MKIIAQRELRNRSGEVLRQAERGETFLITVGGRPVATLGPAARRTWVPKTTYLEAIRPLRDKRWLADIRRLARLTRALDDPFDR